MYRGKYVSYKKAVMLETGITAEEYTKQYDIYKHKVRNWNRATGNIGTDKALSPAETFYYYKKAQQRGYENNLAEAIANVSSATSKKIPANAFDIVATRDRVVFDKFMYKNDGNDNVIERTNIYAQQARELFASYDKGEITATELHQKITDLADNLKEAQEDGMVGSD